MTASTWLEAHLAARGEVPSASVKAAAIAAGLSVRSLQRAAAALGVTVVSRGYPRRTLWSLPGDGATEFDGGATVPEL